eukprot:gene7854-58842_t
MLGTPLNWAAVLERLGVQWDITRAALCGVELAEATDEEPEDPNFDDAADNYL